ncbi:MAG: DUF4340 domain-containing protein [Candidatus Omnitrophica bacterium]|nr:DUF4340 domain-containing protein [Candidatus Omnitrophota bacterium]
MKIKHIIFLGIILLVLLGVLFIKQTLFKPEIETVEYESLKISLQPEDIYTLELKKSRDDDILRFEKGEDGFWRIPEKWDIRAKNDQIEKLINDISQLQGELRSSSAELLSDFGISEEKAFSISMFDKEGKPQKIFYIGSKRPGFGASFLRKGDSSNVYLVNKDVLAWMGIYGDPQEAKFNAEQWMDLSVTNIDVESINSLKIKRRQDEGEIIVADVKKELDQGKDLKYWAAQPEEPIFDLDAKKIKDFLKGINDIRAAKVLEPQAQDYGFDQPYLVISLGADEKIIELKLGKQIREDSEDRYFENSQGHVFELRRYNVDKIDVDISRFFIGNPLRIDKDKLQSLIVDKQGEETVLDKALIEKNTAYIDKIEQFRPMRMLLTEEYGTSLKEPSYSLEIKQDDQVSVLLADIKQEAEEKSYIGQVQGKPVLFEISEDVFNSLFDKLDELDLGKEPAQEPVAQEPAEAEKE